MAVTIAEVHAFLESLHLDAHASGNLTWMKMLAAIESQVGIMEDAKTLDEQKAGCLQLSHAILILQLMQTDQEIARKLNDLRIEVAQFAILGR